MTRALLLFVLVLAPGALAKARKPTGPERLSLFDQKGDLETDLWGPPDATLQAQVDAMLRARAPFAKALANEQLSLVLVDLTRPDQLAAATVRPDWETFPASLGKIAILLGVVDKARTTNHPEELVKLRPSMDRMIKASSNEDASALFAWAGHASIVDAVARHHLYDEKTGGLWWTPSAPWPKSPKGQLRIAATARQVARYFLMMEQGKLVSPDDSRVIKGVLRNAGLALFSQGIQKRFGDTQYYGKPGILGKEIAEGMLIESPGARYIVAIVMKGHDKDDPLFQEFGQALHAMMLERGKTTPGEHGAWTLGLDDGALVLKRPDGGAPIALRPEVHVQWKAASSPLGESAADARWKATDGGFKTVLSTAGSRWDLEATAAGVSASLTWTRAGEVKAAWLELPFTAKAPRMLDAAYRSRAPPVRTGAFSPQVAWFDELTIAGRAGGMSLSVGKDGTAHLKLEAETAASHPFKAWSECVVEATDKPIVTRPPAIDLSARQVAAGDRTTLSFQLLPQTPSVPLLLRYPNGARAALVLTDHADQSNVTRLGALMYGKSTYQAPLAWRGGSRGFANRGLGLTKAVFAFTANGYAKQMEDPRFVELLGALAADGIEIGSHSASGDPDSAQRTREGLERLAPFGSSTWIDHQPTTNCEALTNSGRAETLKLLTAAQYRYAWSGIEDRRTTLNMFEPGAATPTADPLYQHPMTADLWLFPSRWMALERGEFFERLSPEALDRLEAERGLSIPHTYLDIFIEESGTRLDKWTLLEKIPNGYRLSDEADAVFARLQKRQKQGRLWMTTMRALAEHLLAVAQVQWTLNGDVLVLRSAKAVKGLSLLQADGEVRVVDLEAGETRLAWPGGPAPITVR